MVNWEFPKECVASSKFETRLVYLYMCIYICTHTYICTSKNIYEHFLNAEKKLLTKLKFIFKGKNMIANIILINEWLNASPLILSAPEKKEHVVS